MFLCLIPVFRIRITLMLIQMRIRILLVTLKRIRILPHSDADPDPGFQLKAQNLEKELKWDHIPNIFGLSSAN
jgi:hypothetical protein